jgi:pimeloyl-ACP methyl ester carboxylesterase
VTTQLFVHETGDTTSPSIVFLHGAASSGRMWRAQQEELVEYHCLAPDLPEHGQSSQVRPFTLPGAVEAVADLIREKSPTARAHVVGLSVGAAVGLELIRRQPEVVDRAILSGATPRVGAGMILFSELVYIPMLRLLPRERLAALVMKSGGIPAAYQDDFVNDLQHLNADLFRNINRAMSQTALPQGKTPPTLVVVGEKELGISKRHSRAICRSAEGMMCKIVMGVGHAWNMEAPELFNTMVRAWLGNKPLPPALQDL